MTTTINASTSSGIVATADGSGIIKVQSNGVTTNALAWVNLNGTATSGSATIRASYNVSSVTVASAGNYTLNFTNATTDANYSVIGASSDAAGNAAAAIQIFTNTSQVETAPTTSSFIFSFSRFNYAATSSPTYVSVVVFGN